MFAGPFISAIDASPAGRRLSSDVREWPVAVDQAAEMFSLNLSVWKDDPARHRSWSPAPRSSRDSPGGSSEVARNGAAGRIVGMRGRARRSGPADLKSVVVSRRRTVIQAGVRSTPARDRRPATSPVRGRRRASRGRRDDFGPPAPRKRPGRRTRRDRPKPQRPAV